MRHVAILVVKARGSIQGYAGKSRQFYLCEFSGGFTASLRGCNVRGVLDMAHVSTAKTAWK